MLLAPLVLVFPAATLAFWLPIRPRQASARDDCTLITTLAPVTLTSIYPASTIAGKRQGQVTGGGSLIYTTALPTLGPDGPGLHTYTVTAPCPAAECQLPAATECPPGFTTTAVVCHVCGDRPVTTVLTLPSETATAAQGSPYRDGSEDWSTSGENGDGQAAEVCKEGSCVLGPASTPSGFVKSIRPTLLDHAKPTGSLPDSEAPASSDSESSPSPPQSPSSPGAHESPGAPGHHDLPGSSGSSNAPASLDSESLPSTSGTPEEPDTGKSPDAAEFPDDGSSDTSKHPGSPESLKSPPSLGPESPPSPPPSPASPLPPKSSLSPGAPESPDTAQSPGTPKQPSFPTSPRTPSPSGSESSTSPSRVSESQGAGQHPESPKIPEPPKSPTSPTSPNSQKPTTVSNDSTIGGEAEPEVISNGDTTGGEPAPEAVSSNYPSLEATPTPTVVQVTGSAAGNRAIKAIILGPAVVFILLWFLL
ncbi:hypothetical protein ACJZ2D_002110 [Fusarium nematophilum]